MQLLSLLTLGVLCAVQDPFTAFNNDEPPRVATILETFRTNNVEVTRLRFESRPIPTSNGVEKVEIFASLCRPVANANLKSEISDLKSQKRPALLVLHGGGGCAEESRAIGWAKRGYVALAPDLPDIGSPDKLKSIGPFRREKYGEGHYRVLNGDITTCGIYDAVISGLKSLALLRSQPDVDRSRVGIVGVSWGGYMTTMLSGLAGDRVRAAYPVYGCGYYDHGSSGGDSLAQKLSATDRDEWLRWLDAGRRAKGIRCPIFFAAAANDFFFFPSAVMATYKDISTPKNLVFGPNESHSISLPGGTHGWGNDTWTDMEILWFDLHLRGRGEAFPSLQATGAKREGKSIRVSFEPSSGANFTNTAVYYAPGEQHWLMKRWVRVPSDGKSALIPVEEPELPIHWYAAASDARPVTVSTLIETLEPASLGFTAADRSAQPWREDFEAGAAQRWVRRDRTVPKGATVSYKREAAHSGQLGMQISNEYRLYYTGLRGASFQRSGARGLRLWAKSEKPFRIELVAKLPERPEIVWRAAVPAGKEWHQVELDWSAFKSSDKDAPALPCAAVGQARIIGPRDGVACLDDIEELPR